MENNSEMPWIMGNYLSFTSEEQKNIKPYLIVYSDEKIESANLHFDTIHINDVKHENLIG